MRLLVVTNCQAQVALEVVQQEEANSCTPQGWRIRSEGCHVHQSLDPAGLGQPLLLIPALSHAAKSVFPNPVSPAAETPPPAHTAPTHL